MGGLGQGSEDRRQPKSHGLDGLWPSVDEEGLVGVPLSSLVYWTMAWKERSQAAKRNQATHLEKNVHTSGSVSYVTHIQKLETYDRRMVDRYAEDIP
ncbi:hypothetical protein Taro_009198 [Colocasia esculenta]|uniref:Uncharacterized protein n=1 Tax=Colocasia esculenta TaxID=4460 RepID=A0A843U527_COLES|nr:hypothetical protein [Colocasia esculenta]